MNISRAISRIVSYFRRYSYSRAYWRIAACAVMTTVCLSPPLAAATVVRMEISFGGTPAGNIDVELDDRAPKTVANFLRYAGRGAYSNTIIHRHATINTSGVSVIQGGGYNLFGFPYHIHVDPPVQNEFSPLRSNVRGTIAMAKSANPDSATSEWFINLADNAGLDDTNNNNSGGFTVFGHVLDPGMNVVYDVANLQILDQSVISAVFNELPVINYDSSIGLKPNNLVAVTRIPNVASVRTPSGSWEVFTAGVDMTFDSFRAVDTATLASLLAAFTFPPGQLVYFNNGMFTLSMSGTMGSGGHVVTLYDGTTTRPSRYYGYGKTPDNPTPHWYDFTFDNETGAEIGSDHITLHFVDGKRGDDDLTVNGSITHTGAQAEITANPSSQSTPSGGCSITTTPSQTTSNGDWVIISLFLAFVTLVRRRARHNRVQRALH